MWTETLPPLSLYIHLPWCVKKCPYCDFNSYQQDKNSDEKNYVQALLEDLEHELQNTGNRKIQSVFFGGGTPSLFSAESIDTLLNEIKRHKILSENTEITLEANPGTFEQKKFSEFNSAGINRLSIGIQSFNNDLLKHIGRIHDSKQSHSAIDTALNAGFKNINLDLMFGLPGQSVALAVEDVKQACHYPVTHLSHYQLTIEPNTYFHKYPPTQPGMESLWSMQNECHSILNEHGLEQYEVSAFSKEARQCNHNLNYWQFGDYIGIGAGAHGKVTREHDGKLEIRRYWKKKQPIAYMSSKNKTADSTLLDRDQVIFEFLLNTLRLKKGVQLSTFKTTTGLEVNDLIEACQVIDSELLSIDREHIKTTEKGYRFLNDILERFI